MSVTDKEIVEVLARFLQEIMKVRVTESECKLYIWGAGGCRELDVLESLDHMAVVEAEIERRGMYPAYLLKRFGEDSWDSTNGIEMIDPFETAPMLDRQSARTRATAAYHCLTGASTCDTKCPACNGTGSQEVDKPHLGGMVEHGDREQEACWQCGGTGGISE